MKQPAFFQGVLVALLLALAAGATYWLFVPVVGIDLTLRVLIGGVAFVYILYLLSRTRERVGRLTTSFVWLVAAAAGIVFDIDLMSYFLMHVGLVWLIRSLYFHSGILPALGDLLLNGLATGAFVWASVQAGSVFLSVWCFFLVQALFVFIPARIGQPPARPSEVAANQIVRAQRNAEAALQRLLRT